MIKRILRAALGVVFLVVFLLFLLVGALEFRLSAPDFWKTALAKGMVYEQLHDQLIKSLAQMEERLRSQTNGGTVSPEVAEAAMKKLAPILAIDKVLTTERIEELVETNIDRLLIYLKGAEKELKLFLPVKQWNLPVEALGQPALLRLTEQTPIEEVLPILGVKPEQTKSAMAGLEEVKTVVSYLTVIWLVLLAITLLLLVGHYFLGVGVIDRIGGTAWLIMISGFIAKLIGMGADSLFGLIATNSKPPMAAWLAELGKSLIGQFFGLGAAVGLVVGVAGLGGVIWAIYLARQTKGKESKKTIGSVKKVLALVLGITLGLVVLAMMVAGLVLALGGKVDLTVGNKSISVGSAGTLYKSEAGWKMMSPGGWEALKDKNSEGFLKRPTGNALDWGAIEVKLTNRPKEVDGGTWLVAFKKAFEAGALGLKNAELLGEPKESKQGEMKRFDFLIDYDAVISGQEMKLRLWRVEFYPVSQGNGFGINMRVPVESWNKYEKILKGTVDTFEIER